MTPEPSSEHLLSPIPDQALPPEAMISTSLRTLAEGVAEKLDGLPASDGILPLLRLVVPFGDPTGLALPTPVPVVCELGQHFTLHFSPAPEAALAQLKAVGDILQSPELATRCPQIAQVPRPNANILWTTHNQLHHWPAYAGLAVDIQIGLIHLLERANWQQHRAARQTIDATLTALYRILPLIDPGELARAKFPAAAGAIVQRAAQTLTYVRQPDRPLPQETCRGYVRDFCQVINHPEWSASLHGGPTAEAG